MITRQWLLQHCRSQNAVMFYFDYGDENNYQEHKGDGKVDAAVTN